MSIKIYDAYISTERNLCDFSRIRAHCIRLQDRCNLKKIELIRGRFGPANRYREIASSLRDRAYGIKKTGMRDPDVDFSFDITVFPYGSACIYKLYTEQRTFIKLFEEIFLHVRDFHYQDSTDKPDDVMDEEWERRRIAWKYILGSHPPNKMGFTINISDYSWPWFKEVYPELEV